jgi:hypothetical protein
MLTHKGKVIKKAMDSEYGGKKGDKIFYASRNKGTIKGVEKNDLKAKAIRKKMR